MPLKDPENATKYEKKEKRILDQSRRRGDTIIVNKRIIKKQYELYLFLRIKLNIKIGRNCLQKYSLEDHNSKCKISLQN